MELDTTLGYLFALREPADRVAECDYCHRTTALWRQFVKGGPVAYYCRRCTLFLMGRVA